MSPTVSRLLKCPDPEPAAGQAVIEVQASTVGFQDAMIRRGELNAYGFKPGHILGGEVAGTVRAVGDGVDAAWIGRAVWAFVGLGGGYAERIAAPIGALVPLPPGMSPTQAAALGGAGIVAHFALRQARFGPNESLLIRGAAGPIGIMAIQLAVQQGAGCVTVTASSAERGSRLLALGATEMVDREGKSDALDDASFDVILDIVAGSQMRSFLKRLKPNGRMIAVGAVGGFPPADFAADIFGMFQKSLLFGTFSAGSVPLSERHTVVAGLFGAANCGALQMPLSAVLPLADAVMAHKAMEAGQTFGRLILVPS